MIKVNVKEDSVVARLAARKMKSRAVAIVFGTTIHLWGISKAAFLNNHRLVRHELQHVRQYRQHGFVPFLFLYLLECMRHGYYKNRFEIEARNAENKAGVEEGFYIV